MKAASRRDHYSSGDVDDALDTIKGRANILQRWLSQFNARTLRCLTDKPLAAMGISEKVRLCELIRDIQRQEVKEIGNG